MNVKILEYVHQKWMYLRQLLPSPHGKAKTVL